MAGLCTSTMLAVVKLILLPWGDAIPFFEVTHVKVAIRPALDILPWKYGRQLGHAVQKLPGGGSA